NGRPYTTGGVVVGKRASARLSRMTKNPPIPLSKSASASHVISLPPLPLEVTRTLNGGSGGVTSATVPFLTYSIQILATCSFGSQTASRGVPLKEEAGSAVWPRKGASQAVLMSTGLRF